MVGRIDAGISLSYSLVDQAHLVDLVGQLAGHLVPGGGVLAAGSMVRGGLGGGGHPI